jgi:DNA repair exonuclease SbcCD ATPase subunit
VVDSVNQVEELVRELKLLAKKKPLPKRSLERAKELMRKLKSMGFTNREISGLTGGGWSEPSVKNYTRGVSVEDPIFKKTAIDLLQELVDEDLTLYEVKGYMSLRKRFEAEGFSFEELPNLLERLDELGVSVDGLKTIVESAERYGRYEEVLKAIEAYSSLQSLNKEVEKQSDVKSRVNQEIEKMRADMESLKEQRNPIIQDLELYRRLENRGFNYDRLGKMQDASEAFSSFEEVLDAINTYKSLEELKTELSTLQDDRKKVDTEVKNLEAKLAHLESLNRLCKTLLYEYGFGVQAVENLYKVAKQFGSPFEVLRALSEYGELETLRQEVERFKARKRELETIIGELKSQIQELRGTVAELNRYLKKMLTSTSTKITEGVDQLENSFTKTLSEISRNLTETMRRMEETHSKVLAQNASSLRSAVNNLAETSMNLQNVYGKAITKISNESIEVGKLLERIDAAETRLKSDVMPLFHLVTKPTQVKEPPEEVMQSALAYVTALHSYVEVNKGQIENEYLLSRNLESLREELARRSRNA